ncbi:MAG: thioredoxin family protein [Actinomycetota bacterium]
MTPERVVVLVIVVVAAVIAAALYGLLRRRWGEDVERLEVADLGLELMSGCCAFVVFTTAACRPCKAALRIVEGAASKSSGLTEVTTVDAMERSDMTLRYNVRTIPTVFLITASGHVVKRWRDVPEPDDVDAVLAAL